MPWITGATISNNSWGGKGESQALRDAIVRAGQQGHLFVSAAGNGGSDGVGDDNDEAPFYPASYGNQNIISAAATDRDDRLAGFSNFGDTSVDLGAPGARILSTLPGGGYGRFSGTSMASPHVAGTAALIKSADPSLAADGLKRRILESAEGKSALRNKTVTGGRLNAATALNAQSRATEVSVSAERSALVFGQRISFSGGLVDASGEPIVGENVVLLERPFGADRFSRVTDGKATTNLQGQFTIDGVKLEKLTVYRALFTGNEAKAIERSVSGPEVVRVRARVTTRTAKDVVSLGRGQGVAGRVLPDHGGRVRLVIFRNGDVFDRERLSLDSNSRFSYVFRPPRRGTYKVYAVFPGDDDHLAKRGPIRTFKVVR